MRLRPAESLRSPEWQDYPAGAFRTNRVNRLKLRIPWVRCKRLVDHQPEPGEKNMKPEWNSLFRMIVPAGVLGTATFTMCSQSAEAFFPPIPPPPTNITVDPPPVVPPVVVPPVVVPPVPPPPFVPPPPPPPPVVVPPPPPPPVVVPQVVPEPASMTSAALGLVAVAGWVARRRMSQSKPEQPSDAGE